MTLDLIEDDLLFKPNEGGQQLFLDDYINQYIALAGGWFAGKTWVGARKLASLHVHNAFDAKGQPTFVKGLCVGQNYSLARQVNIPELQAAFDEMGLSHRFVSDPKRYCFEFPDLGTKGKPSELIVRSGDSPETINAFTVGHLWGDEVPRWATSEDDPKRDSWLQAKGRLRDPRANTLQAILTFTHEGDGTRVYRDFEEKPLPKHKLYRAGTFENPFAKEFAATMEGQLTPELADQYLKGLAVNFRGGKVYVAYSDENKRSDLELDKFLPLHLSMDFNINPGMHGILGQFLPGKNALTAVHEFHEKSMSAIQMLEAFRALIGNLGGWQWPELHLFGDASGGGRFEATGESAWEIVRAWLQQRMPEVKTKFYVSRSNPEVADRVHSFNCALRSIDGTIKYYVHERCERLLQDFKALKWEGNELGKKDRKLSHASDADGYRVYVLMPIRKFELSSRGSIGFSS